MQVEFGEYKTTARAKQLVNETLESSWLTLGKRTEQLESLWKETFNYPFARAVNSGTSANLACGLALLEINAKRGDNFIVPALSFIASCSALVAAGLEPKFVDVGTDMNINCDLIEEAIDGNTRCIVAVNLMGTVCDLQRIREIADKHNLVVIVDNCESYAAKYKGNFSLEYGDFETSSMFSAHLCFGVENSVVSTKKQEYDELIWAIRSHGRPNGQHWFDHKYMGLNLKPNDLCCSIACASLEDFWEIFEKRKKNYYRLREFMRPYNDVAFFTEEVEGNTNAPHAFSITLKNQYHHLNSIFIRYLNNKGIHTKLNFGTIPNHGAFRYLGIPKDKFPVSNMMGAGGHVAVHQYLRDDQLDFMERTIKVFFESIK